MTITLTSGERFEIDSFTDGYITAALWSSTDESTPAGGDPMDENYGPQDLAPATMRAVIEDCRNFQRDNEGTLTAVYEGTHDGNGPARPPDHCGHDFWLTRNGHGTGFWDRGLGNVGDRLSDAASACGEVNLYIGDDGRIYQS